MLKIALSVLVAAQAATNSSQVATIAAGCTQKSCPFSYTNPDNVNEGRCGEVDAASRMPADIFKDPRKVGEYVLATTKWYHIDGVKLVQAACNPKWNKGGSQSVSWTDPTLMKYTCGTGCDCNYPACPDAPDVPRNEQYCSLCGPKFNKDIEVQFYYPGTPPVPHSPTPHPTPPAPAPATKTIVDLAVATADLSTLVAALKAGKLVDTLSGAGPFTVFAPNNHAFDQLPAATLASLLEPKNIKQLQDVLTYHVVSGSRQAADLKDHQEVKTVEGKDVKVSLVDGHVILNRQRSAGGYSGAEVITADIEATNGVVHIIDAVLIPPASIAHLRGI